MIPRHTLARLLVLTIAAVCSATGISRAQNPTVIECDGRYKGHLQGLATDGNHIYWSFTVTLVKTGMNGAIVDSLTVPTHHGDLVYHDGLVYVAVNLGLFNREAGEADSWVYVYNANDLSFIARYPAQEAVHGAGGMTVRDGRFFVVGGLPEGYTENYVYEYDSAFKYIRRHVLASGYTRLGIQTACYADGHFWFGCYGMPNNCGLMRTGSALDSASIEQYSIDVSVGIDRLPNGDYLMGSTGREESGAYWGRAKVVTSVDLLGARFKRPE